MPMARQGGSKPFRASGIDTLEPDVSSVSPPRLLQRVRCPHRSLIPAHGCWPRSVRNGVRPSLEPECNEEQITPPLGSVYEALPFGPTISRADRRAHEP